MHLQAIRTIGFHAATALLLIACGDDPAGDGGDEPGPDAGASQLLEPPAEGEGFQLGFDVDLEAGDEIEYCRYFVLPGSGALDVERFEHAYSQGSHHLLLYQTGLEASDVDDEMFPCAGASFDSLGVTGVAYGAQVPSGELAYPDGVALKVAAGDVVLMQSHYLNATDLEVEAQVRLNFWLAPEPAAIEAGTLFFYDWSILIPEGQSATARMSCAVPGDVDLVFAMSHMHRRGVGYRSWLAGGELPSPEMLYTTDQWENVEPQMFQPEKRVVAGQRIDFECDYMGESDRTIVDGPSAVDDEMCMFVAAYYPRLDAAAEQCTGPASGPILDGDKTCAETLGCVRATDDRVATEECVQATCAPSADPARSLMTCVFNHCQAVCAHDDDPECQPCVQASCGSQLDGCLNATCE